MKKPAREQLKKKKLLCDSIVNQQEGGILMYHWWHKVTTYELLFVSSMGEKMFKFILYIQENQTGFFDFRLEILFFGPPVHFELCCLWYNRRCDSTCFHPSDYIYLFIYCCLFIFRFWTLHPVDFWSNHCSSNCRIWFFFSSRILFF